MSSLENSTGVTQVNTKTLFVASETKHAHAGLMNAAQALRASLESRDRVSLDIAVNHFYVALLKHFRKEEGPSGWFREIEQREPRLKPIIDTLRGQHAELLASLEAVRSENIWLPEEVVSEVRRCLRIFRRHERVEERLVCEVFYQDIGTVGGR